MFNVPPSTASGGVRWSRSPATCRTIAEHGVKPHIATLHCVRTRCALAARWFGMTKIIMTVPTLLVVIPDRPRCGRQTTTADINAAIESGVSTALVVVAMVAGLSGARMLTDPEDLHPARRAPCLPGDPGDGWVGQHDRAHPRGCRPPGCRDVQSLSP